MKRLKSQANGETNMARSLPVVSYQTKTAVEPRAEYVTLYEVFDWFNAELWDGGLSQVVLTFTRKKGARGYFHAEQFSAKGNAKDTIHQIALNPDSLDRPDIEVVSTLVHEMAHLWQQVFGKPSRNGYHNAQWADEMERIGLMPSTTGDSNGKRTGPKVTHYILDGGAFQVAWNKLAEAKGCQLTLAGIPKAAKAAKKRESKVKFTCSTCGQNAWAKPDAALICGDCQEPMA